MFTLLPYHYRCASNFKQDSIIVLQGALSAKDIADIQARLNDHTGFIPGDLAGIDVEELQPRSEDYPNEDDHVWHTLNLEDLQTVEAAPQGALTPIAAERFMEAFRKIDGSHGWDVEAAVIRLDI